MPDWLKDKLESKLPGEIINNLRYADNTTLMTESKEELKSLFHFHQEALYYLHAFFFPTRVEPSAYLRLLIFLPAILIPACASSSLEFSMMYSAYKLNKQGDNIQS